MNQEDRTALLETSVRLDEALTALGKQVAAFGLPGQTAPTYRRAHYAGLSLIALIGRIVGEDK